MPQLAWRLARAPEGNRHADQSRCRQRPAAAQGDRHRGDPSAPRRVRRGRADRVPRPDRHRDREAARRAATGLDRLQDLQEHAGAPGGERCGPGRARRAPRRAGRDRVRAPGRRRRGDGREGTPRLRPDQPQPGRQGRHPRHAPLVDAGSRGPRRRAAARRAARAARRRIPGPARQGGRSVPGLHPQLRLRPQGLRRPASRRRRSARGRREPEAHRAQTHRQRRQARVGGVTGSDRGASRPHFR